MTAVHAVMCLAHNVLMLFLNTLCKHFAAEDNRN